MCNKLTDQQILTVFNKVSDQPRETRGAGLLVNRGASFLVG
jgi:hypothetical protein